MFFCTDHEELFNRPYATVQTNAVTNITSSGAQFHAQLLQLNGNAVLDHGFVWGDDQYLSLATDNKNSMGPLEGGDGFSAEIATTLKEGQIYYVKAYLKTEKLTIFGSAVSFKSLGSKAPVIIDFEPKSGRTFDTISIKGVGFSFVKTDNEVKFNDKKAEIISQSDTLLSVKVPGALNVLKSKISVSVVGNITNSTDDFSLLGPEIAALSASLLFPCDTLTISGRNFPETIDGVKVYLNTTECKIIDLRANQIKILSPVFQPANEQVTLKVVSSNIETVFNQTITYKKPTFIGLKTRSNTTFNDTLTIVTKNLPQCNSMNIKIGSETPVLVVANDSIISFKVPESLTTTQNTVSITFTGSTVSYSQQFSLSSPTITLITPDNGTFNDVITIRGKNFHPQKERNIVSLAGIGVQALTVEPTKLTAKVSVNGSAVCGNCQDLYLQIDQQSISINNGFTLNAPVITSISPTSMSAPGQVTINGENFNPQANLNEVFIGNPATIVSATSQKIIARRGHQYDL